MYICALKILFLFIFYLCCKFASAHLTKPNYSYALTISLTFINEYSFLLYSVLSLHSTSFFIFNYMTTLVNEMVLKDIDTNILKFKNIITFNKCTIFKLRLPKLKTRS